MTQSTYTATFTDEIQTIIPEDGDWTEPEYCFEMIVEMPESDDADIAHINGDTIPTVLAVEFNNAEDWEPEIYTRSIEAAGWKVIEAPSGPGGEWALQWAGK